MKPLFRAINIVLLVLSVSNWANAQNVGIGTTTPTSLFSVGTGSPSPFQVNSTGAIAAATGITSSGTIAFSTLNAGGILKATASTGQMGIAASSDIVSAASGAFILNQSGAQSGANFNVGGTGTLGGLLTANAGITASGAAISLNNSSNFTTSIGTGTTTSAVNVGNGNSTQTIAIGNNLTAGTSVKTVNIGSTISSSATNINAGTGGVNVSTLTTGGLVKATASTGLIGIAASSDVVTAANGAFILNQAGTQSGANFNVGGSGIIGTNLTVTGNVAIGGTSPGHKLVVSGTTNTEGFEGKMVSISVSGNSPSSTLDSTVYFVLLTNGGAASHTADSITLVMPDAATVGAGHTIIIRSAMDNSYELVVASATGKTQLVDLGKSNLGPTPRLDNSATSGDTYNWEVAVFMKANVGSGTTNGAQTSVEFISDGALWYRVF